MTTNAIVAAGSTVEYDGVTLGEIQSINGPGATTTMIRVHSCDSTNNKADKLAGAIDEGQVSIKYVFHGTAGNVYGFLRNHQKASSLKTLKVTYSDGSYEQGSALVVNPTRPSFGDSENTVVETNCTFEWSGDVQFFDTAGSSISVSASASASSSASSSVSSSASASGA